MSNCLILTLQTDYCVLKLKRKKNFKKINPVSVARGLALRQFRPRIEQQEKLPNFNLYFV